MYQILAIVWSHTGTNTSISSPGPKSTDFEVADTVSIGSILTPGKSPKIKDVTNFPGQTLVQADRSMLDGYRPNWEVRMLMYYDRMGAMKAAGFEARLREKDGTVEKEGWNQASL